MSSRHCSCSAVGAAGLALALTAIACGSPTDAPRRLRSNGQILFGTYSGTFSDPTYGLVVVDPDGSHRTTIAPSPLSTTDYGDWSPDGAWIATDAAGARDSSTIDVVDRMGANRHTIATGGHHPVWSPDGSSIAFECGNDLCLVGADGGTVASLTHTGVLHYNLSWSPDGRRIAFTSAPTGEPAIFVVDTAGTSVRAIAQSPSGDVGSAWSPVSEEIAFIRRLGAQGDWELRIVRADGTGERLLTDKVANSHPPAWSPDGRQLAFATLVGTKFQIAVINADGTGYTQLTALPDGAQEPAWSPDETQIAFLSGKDIYVMHADGTQLTNITNTPDLIEYLPDWGALPVP